MPKIVAGTPIPKAALINENAPRREISLDWISTVMPNLLGSDPARNGSNWPAYRILTLIWINGLAKRRMPSVIWGVHTRRYADGRLELDYPWAGRFIGCKIVDRRGQGFWLDVGLGIVGAIVGDFCSVSSEKKVLQG